MAERVDTVVSGTLVDVHTGHLRAGHVAVDDGEIVALADRPADRRLDANYVAPGLIDAHVHVESSMVTLPEYGRAVLPRGVTSVVYDPHELANVLGEAGVRAVVADGAETPLKARFTVPSSVPASELQDAGATVDADAVASLLDLDGVVALGEVMDIPGLLARDESVHAKIRAARERGLVVDGHMPGVAGERLDEAARFLDTDHESVTLAEARERVERGVRVHLREGSSSRNLSALLPLVEEVDSRRLALCTDDREVVDLIDEGGVDHAVRRAMAAGADPVEVVQMATLNAAEAYDLPFGRLAPGAPADLVLLDDLEDWAVDHVLVDGRLDPTAGGETGTTDLPRDTVTFDPVDAETLAVDAPGGSDAGPVEVRVVDAVGGIQTEAMATTVPAADGRLLPDPAADVAALAVIERHGKGGGIGRGFVHGLGIDRGAVGSTVAHDAHNCVVAGADHESMATVANHLREVGGGVAAYDPDPDPEGEAGPDGEGARDAGPEGLTSLALPVAGLVSEEPIETVAERYEAVESRAAALGLVDAGLMELSFLALEVIPTYRLTNRGLVDVEAGDYVDVVVG
jgi:adenine deaminase